MKLLKRKREAKQGCSDAKESTFKSMGLWKKSVGSSIQSCNQIIREGHFDYATSRRGSRAEATLVTEPIYLYISPKIVPTGLNSKDVDMRIIRQRTFTIITLINGTLMLGSLRLKIICCQMLWMKEHISYKVNYPCQLSFQSN